MNTERKIILLVTSSGWSEAPRLRHQMANKLLDWFDIIWIQVPSSSSPVNVIQSKPKKNLTIIQLPKRNRLQELLWDNIPLFHKYYNRILVKQIQNRISNYDIANINMITFQINFVEVIGLVDNGFSIYVCNDPFPSYRRKYHKMLFERYESRIAKKVDMSLAVSLPLVKQLKRYSPNVNLFLPSHDLDTSEYVKIGINTIPVLLYMGFIDKRINFSWIRKIAKKHPGFIIRFIGPIKSEEDVKELKEYDNIEFIETITGERLHSELLKASVLLLPFKGDNLTVQYMSAPNKLFQYLATGRPIVSCVIPYLISLPDKCVYQSKDYDDFESNILSALKHDNSVLGEIRIKVAFENSWKFRGEDLKRVINSLPVDGKKVKSIL